MSVSIHPDDLFRLAVEAILRECFQNPDWHGEDRYIESPVLDNETFDKLQSFCRSNGAELYVGKWDGKSVLGVVNSKTWN